MVRPRTFDIDEALEAALLVFWEKGYEGTTLSDLLTATGLSKSSLYETFGSKRELFLRSIDHFHSTRMTSVGESANDGRPALESIRSLLVTQSEQSRPGNKRQGCFLGKCAVDCAPDDTTVVKRIDAGMTIIRGTFTAIVERGQAAGDISKSSDPKTLGDLLTTTFYGLQIMSSSGASRARLSRTIESIVDSLAATAP